MIWIVTTGEYDSYTVEAAFTDEATAEAWADRMNLNAEIVDYNESLNDLLSVWRQKRTSPIYVVEEVSLCDPPIPQVVPRRVPTKVENRVQDSWDEQLQKQHALIDSLILPGVK